MTTLGKKLEKKAKQYYDNKEAKRNKQEEEAKRNKMEEKAKEIWKFISSIFEDAKPEDYDEFVGYRVIFYLYRGSFFYKRSWGSVEEVNVPYDYCEFSNCADLVMKYAIEEEIRAIAYSEDGSTFGWGFNFLYKK